MNKELTKRQESILNFIREFILETGYPPTLREIGKNFGISSTFGVKRHLEALVKKGFLNIETNASRGITLLKNPASGSQLASDEGSFFRIPIIGRVAAGSPILAIENIDGFMIIDSSFIKKADKTFALKVQGDSMIRAGINEGDFVIVSQDEHTKSGDIIVALLDDEATVKKLNIKDDKISLIPENEHYQPIIINNTESFRIIGKVKGVVRWIN